MALKRSLKKYPTTVPGPLAAAISQSSGKYNVRPDVLTGIWRIESGSNYPNPYVNSSGYGGLFGTRNWNAPLQDQADTAAEILATQIRQKGSLSAALSAYSGGGYSTLGGINTGPSAPAPTYTGQLPAVVGNTQGLKQDFLNAVLQAAGSLGASQIVVTSGLRTPEHNAAVGGVPRSNHLTGTAIDGYAIINGQKIPLGTALKAVAGRFGLRSGDQPGFYQGGPDTVHVDSAGNVGGVGTGYPATTVSSTQTVAGVPQTSAPSNVPFKPVTLSKATPTRTTQQVLGGEGGPYAAPGKPAVPTGQAAIMKQLADLIASLRGAPTKPGPYVNYQYPIPGVNLTPAQVAAGSSGVPSYATTAAQLAQQAVAAATNPLIAAQTAARTSATANAAEINKASLAAAEFLKGLEASTQGSYQSAADQQTARAALFTGDLRDTAAAEAARSQEMLASVPGNTQVVDDKSAHLANLLGGLSGELPGRTLGAQGLAAVASARAIPGQTIAYGQEQANAALGAGEQAASQYTLPISQAAAQLPILQQQYMQDFSTQAATAKQNDFDNAVAVIKLLQTQQAAATKAAGKTATPWRIERYGKDGTIRVNQATGAWKIIHRDSGGSKAPKFQYVKGYGTVRTNWDGSTRLVGPPVETTPTVKSTTFPVKGVGVFSYNPVTGTAFMIPGTAPVGASTSKRTTFNVTGVGRFSYDPATNTTTFLTGTKPVSTTATGPGGLTQTAYTSLLDKIGKQVETWHSSKTPGVRIDRKTGLPILVDPDTGKVTKDTTRGVQVPIKGTGKGMVSYRQALARAIARGPKKNGKTIPTWVKDATDLVNGIYKMGEAGRPRDPANQAAEARTLYAEWAALRPDELGYGKVVTLIDQMLEDGVTPALIVQTLPEIAALAIKRNPHRYPGLEIAYVRANPDFTFFG